MKHILKYICILSVIVCFFPLVVFAEDATYIELDSNTSFNVCTLSNNQVIHVNAVGSGSLRLVGGGYALNSSNRKYFFIVSDQSFTCTYGYSPAQNINATIRSSGGYYYTDGINLANVISSVNCPYIVGNGFNDTLAIYYTFGAGAVDPVPPVEPINWGILRDVSYSTRIAGNGSASARNVDYINWNNLLDANGNAIDECTVQIQVVPGGWTGSTEQELLSKGFEAFNGSQYSPVTIASVNASVGTFSISWQGVVNELGWNWESLYSRLEDELWRINGWYYQVRLLAPDGYIGSWQTVYTAASGSAQGLQNVINSNTFNENLYQYITDLSIINNQQTIQYTINETTYLVNNPEYEPDHEPDENGNDYTDILRAIRIGVVNLLTGIAHLPENIIGLLPDLFTFNFVEELPEDQELETAVRDTLDETYYGDLVVALSRFKDTFNDNRNFVGSSADSGMIIIPDLGFDWAGEHITIVESQVFNLYNWVASDPDMFTAYNLYLNIVDGIIYISLFRTLFKRMLGSLDKGG